MFLGAVPVVIEGADDLAPVASAVQIGAIELERLEARGLAVWVTLIFSTRSRPELPIPTHGKRHFDAKGR
jgi:hypothetical protein